MNDRDSFIEPKKKVSKCWDYDISQNHVTGPIELTTQVGSKKTPVHVLHNRRYIFEWTQVGEYWFTEIEGAVA